jgi:hypothetical protein
MVTNGDGLPAGSEPLGRSLAELLTEARGVRQDVQEDQRQRREVAHTLRRAVKAALIVAAFCAVLLVAMLAVVLYTNRTAKAAEDAARDSRQTSELVADCVTVGGKCQAASTERTRQAISQLVRSQLYIIECSRELPVTQYPPGPAFDARFEKCVAVRLAKPAGPPK